MAKNTVNPEIDAYMSQYIDELKKFSPEKFLQKNLNIFNKKHSF
jgi:hypothetical protein